MWTPSGLKCWAHLGGLYKGDWAHHLGLIFIQPSIAAAIPHTHDVRPGLAVHRPPLHPARVDTLEASHLRCLDEPFEGTTRHRPREITVHGSSLFAGDRRREEETTREIGYTHHQLYFRYGDCVSSGKPDLVIYFQQHDLGCAVENFIWH